VQTAAARVLQPRLDELGIAEDINVMYSTDTGVHYNSWPNDGQVNDGQVNDGSRQTAAH
jgi:hypothetical protein